MKNRKENHENREEKGWNKNETEKKMMLEEGKKKKIEGKRVISYKGKNTENKGDHRNGNKSSSSSSSSCSSSSSSSIAVLKESKKKDKYLDFDWELKRAVSEGCRIRQPHFCRGVRPLPQRMSSLWH